MKTSSFKIVQSGNICGGFCRERIWMEYNGYYHCVSCGAKIIHLSDMRKISSDFECEEVAKFIIKLVDEKTSHADYKG